jgi:integrase
LWHWAGSRFWLVCAEGLKPSHKDGIEGILRVHLVPAFGTLRLGQINDEAVQRLKGRLVASGAKPKTVNNVVNVLSVILRRAVAWKVIDAMPCQIKVLKVGSQPFSYYEFPQYHDDHDLVEAARALGSDHLVLVLLGGDAGLRRGEIIGLRWPDVDLKRGVIHVQRSTWGEHTTAPKGGRSRRVPMTKALAEALRAHRHLRGEHVLCHEDGTAVGKKFLEEAIQRATRRAGLEASRNLHPLRHSFCSHLAMQGALAKAIQELAGHTSLTTTLRYMHLSPAVKDAALRLLDRRPTGDAGGSPGGARRGRKRETAGGVGREVWGARDSNPEPTA